ncbi:hypothetical protein [Streptomyces sp. RFCAC02]|uniref:AMIN-like domain-containing (lipo)protein n=1 Tax=Streptomyces sp. RFCAC02 TaxID=2499143 RepID=UPI00102232D1|nr:hypothetical protein [Streptomyces sp. RFCAC02]
MPRHPALPLAAVVCAAALALTACGGDDDPAPEATTGATEDDANAAGLPGDGWATERSSSSDSTAEAAVLDDVALSRHDGYDRVTFTFTGDTPGYIAEYTDTVYPRGGDGGPVDVAGDEHLVVVLVSVDPTTAVTATGTTELIREVADLGFFEGESGVALGLDPEGEGHAPFRVTTEDGRLMVDIAHSAAA